MAGFRKAIDVYTLYFSLAILLNSLIGTIINTLVFPLTTIHNSLKFSLSNLIFLKKKKKKPLIALAKTYSIVIDGSINNINYNCF